MPSFIGRVSGVVLALLIAAGAMFEYLVFRSMAGAALLAGLLGLNAIVTPYALSWLRPDLFRWLTLGFLTIGLAALLLSILHAYPENRLLPVEDGFILRHAYFVLLWLPILLGGVHMWSQILGPAARFCRRWGLGIMALIMIFDLGSSAYFPNQGNEWVGYVHFLEKVSTAFLFTTIYLFHIAFSRRALWPVALITVYFGLCQALGLGVMFNASTGQFIYGVLVVASLPWLGRFTRSLLVLGMYLGVFAILAIGLFTPETFAFDENVYLRLVWWRDNFISLWQSHMVGVGFGTPYFPLNYESLTTADRLAQSAPLFEWAYWDPLDALYVRAQHSSIVNMFYRLGVVGGGLFLFLNAYLSYRLLRLVRSPDQFVSRVSFVALVTGVINLWQITMHVGLESPRFFLVYMLTMALGCLCMEMEGFARRPAGRQLHRPTSAPVVMNASPG